MKWWKVKFTYSVELGAYLAYKGHFKRTGDCNIKNIAGEEAFHRSFLFALMHENGQKPNEILDFIFRTIGNIVAVLCRISPLFLLNKVAYLLELFAIYSYNDLAKEFPVYEIEFMKMAMAEERHKDYFKKPYLSKWQVRKILKEMDGDL